MAAQQQSIFICYRREDTGGDAGRTFDRLSHAFGEAKVFKDVDSIRRGVRFKEYVPGIIAQCRAVIVLIGPHWLDARDEHGRRLDSPDDLVRIEIETALATPGVQVIPLLVAGARLPRREELPVSLASLLDLHVAELRRDPDFNVDVARLVRDLETTAKKGTVLARRVSANLRFIVAGAVTFGAALTVVFFWLRPAPESSNTPQGQAASAAPTTPEIFVSPPPPPPPPPAVSGTWSGVYRCSDGFGTGQTTYQFNTSNGRLTGASETFHRGFLGGAAFYEVSYLSGDGRTISLHTNDYYSGYDVDFQLSADGRTLEGSYRNHPSCNTVTLENAN